MINAKQHFCNAKTYTRTCEGCSTCMGSKVCKNEYNSLLSKHYINLAQTRNMVSSFLRLELTENVPGFCCASGWLASSGGHIALGDSSKTFWKKKKLG